MGEKWKKLIDSNPLFESFHKDMEENLKALSEAETHLGVLEAKGDFGRPFIVAVRDIRVFKAKQTDLMRRIDALMKPQSAGQTPEPEVKTEPKTARSNHKKAK